MKDRLEGGGRPEGVHVREEIVEGGLLPHVREGPLDVIMWQAHFDQSTHFALAEVTAAP